MNTIRRIILVVVLIFAVVALVLYLLLAPNVAETLKTWGEIAQYWLSSVAILAAGLWAYFHFRKGRTYAVRLGFKVSLQEMVDLENDELIAILRVTIKNTSEGYIKNEECFVKVIPINRLEDADTEDTDISYGQNLPFFEEIKGLEPDEEASSEELIPVGDTRLFKVIVRFIYGPQKARQLVLSQETIVG